MKGYFIAKNSFGAEFTFKLYQALVINKNPEKYDCLLELKLLKKLIFP